MLSIASETRSAAVPQARASGSRACRCWKHTVEVNMANIQSTSAAGSDLVRRPSWVVPVRGSWQGISACAIVLAEDTGRVLVKQCVPPDGAGLEWSTWTADVLAGQSP